MKTAIYIRTAAQPGNSEPQRAQLKQWAEKNGVTIAKEYEDAGAPGPALDSLLADVATEKINLVLCASLDRMGRGIAEASRVLTHLAEHKCGLVLVAQGIDTRVDSPQTRLALNMMAAVAQFETDTKET